VTCIDPSAKDRVANYKCTCIVCKSTDQSGLDRDGGGGLGWGQRGEEGEDTDEEEVEGEAKKVGNFIFIFGYISDNWPILFSVSSAQITNMIYA
jgi:hypothetical protein